jgi:hypothetical protein
MVSAVTATHITAVSAAVTAVMAVVTGVVGIMTLFALRRDSHDRTRPLMSAELRPRILARGTAELVVANVGHSVAKDIQVTFEPPLPELDSQDREETMASFLRRRYAQRIPTLAPGHELVNIYAQLRGDGSHGLRESVPYDLTVTFEYGDDRGNRYTDGYSLTVETLMNETTSNPSNEDERGMKRRWVSALETIARGVGRK